MQSNTSNYLFLGLIGVLLLPSAINNLSEYRLRTQETSVATAHISAGDSALNGGRYLIAEKAYAEALTLRPASTEARRGLRRAQATRIVENSEKLSLNDAYNLVYRFMPMPTSDPKYAETYHLALGTIYQALNQTEKAEKAFSSATMLPSVSARAWSARARRVAGSRERRMALPSAHSARRRAPAAP